MSDIPGSHGDASESDNESDPEDGSNSPKGSNSNSGNQGSQPEEIGEEHKRYPASEILAGRNTSEILDRLLDGDPLGIRERSVQRMREQCYLLSLSRLYTRTLARVAHSGASYKGKPPFNEWIKLCIDQSATELMNEELEAERSNKPLPNPPAPHHTFVTALLGIALGLTRRGCIRFNNLELEARQIFFAICVDGLAFHRYVAEGNGPPQRVKCLLGQALKAFTSTLEEPEFGSDEVLGEDWGELP